MRPKPDVSLEEFGAVVPNTYPMGNARFVLRGAVLDFWYRRDEMLGTAPHFMGPKVAERHLRRMYRKYGHLVTPERAAEAMREQAERDRESVREFYRAVAMDMVAGRATVRDGRVTVAGLGSARIRR